MNVERTAVRRADSAVSTYTVGGGGGAAHSSKLACSCGSKTLIAAASPTALQTAVTLNVNNILELQAAIDEILAYIDRALKCATYG